MPPIADDIIAARTRASGPTESPISMLQRRSISNWNGSWAANSRMMTGSNCSTLTRRRRSIAKSITQASSASRDWGLPSATAASSADWIFTISRSVTARTI